jgi:hypothetical protein
MAHAKLTKWQTMFSSFMKLTHNRSTTLEATRDNKDATRGNKCIIWGNKCIILAQLTDIEGTGLMILKL